jgi:hypothetical protein
VRQVHCVIPLFVLVINQEGWLDVSQGSSDKCVSTVILLEIDDHTCAYIAYIFFFNLVVGIVISKGGPIYGLTPFPPIPAAYYYSSVACFYTA